MKLFTLVAAAVVLSASFVASGSAEAKGNCTFTETPEKPSFSLRQFMEPWATFGLTREMGVEQISYECQMDLFATMAEMLGI